MPSTTMEICGRIDKSDDSVTGLTHLSDSIFDSLFPGGLQYGRRARRSSKDLFMSFILARSRSQALFLYCSEIQMREA